MKIAIFGRFFSDEFSIYIQHLIIKLESENCKLLVYSQFIDFLKQKIDFNTDIESFSEKEDLLKEKVDFLISIGGDGTILDTIKLVEDSEIPILGINTGRLGFLSSISKDEINSSIEDILRKKYKIESRTLLKVNTSINLFGKNNYALNELSILKNFSTSMISIKAYINDDYLNTYWADGIIVATPTGSTAYSLSCGGPILTPDSKNFIITPIASHNLTVRPIVIPDSSIIKLKVEGREQNFIIGLDSRSETYKSSIELIIKKEDFKINLIKIFNETYYSTIRNKLMWGIDKRN
ncbi:MAG: NAD kinase [Bacteroidetes bacterium]|nr:NAD kinase [Bacteroidota bacterium]